MLPCLSCGTELVEGGRFCSHCGSAVTRAEGYSIRAILRIKNLSKKDWDRIAQDFRALRRGHSLIPWLNWMTWNSAWDNYYSGYSDGFDAGVNRATGLTEEDLQLINDYELENPEMLFDEED